MEREKKQQRLCLNPPNPLFAKGPYTDHKFSGCFWPSRLDLVTPPVPIFAITYLILAHIELTNATFHSQTFLAQSFIPRQPTRYTALA